MPPIKSDRAVDVWYASNVARKTLTPKWHDNNMMHGQPDCACFEVDNQSFRFGDHECYSD